MTHTGMRSTETAVKAMSAESAISLVLGLIVLLGVFVAFAMGCSKFRASNGTMNFALGTDFNLGLPDTGLFTGPASVGDFIFANPDFSIFALVVVFTITIAMIWKRLAR